MTSFAGGFDAFDGTFTSGGGGGEATRSFPLSFPSLSLSELWCFPPPFFMAPHYRRSQTTAGYIPPGTAVSSGSWRGVMNSSQAFSRQQDREGQDAPSGRNVASQLAPPKSLLHWPGCA